MHLGHDPNSNGRMSSSTIITACLWASCGAAMIKLLALKHWLRKHYAGVAIVIVTVISVASYYAMPKREGKQLSELEACKRQCAPLAGAMEGQRRFPNSPDSERRNYSTHAKCVCH